MSRKDRPTRLASGSQLRGDALVEHLVAWVQHLATQSHVEGRRFELNAKKLSEASGVSRKTVSRRIPDIEQQLGQDLKLYVRKHTGRASRNRLKAKLHRAIAERDAALLKLEENIKHMMRIYRILATKRGGWDSDVALKELQLPSSDGERCCPLCGRGAGVT